MKKLLILFFVSTVARAQTVSMDSTKYFDGSLKTVCGKLIEMVMDDSSNAYLNFGNNYPNQTFTAVVSSKDFFVLDIIPKDVDKKQTCVTGMIKVYKDKPEIIIKSKDQIRFPDSKE